MKAPFLANALVLVAVLAGFTVNGQTTPATPPAQSAGDSGITPNGAIGEVKVIDNGTKQLILLVVALAEPSGS